MEPATRPSYVTCEPPDIVHWHLIGHVEAADIKRIYETQMAFSEGKPYLFILLDVSRLTHITPEARRAAAEGPVPGKQVMPVRGSAVIGASFHIRVIGILVDKAASVINRTYDTPLRFFDTDAEARAWFEERRRELAGKQANAR